MLHSPVRVQAIPPEFLATPAPAATLFNSASVSSFMIFPDGCSKFSVLVNGFLKSFIVCISFRNRIA